MRLPPGIVLAAAIVRAPDDALRCVAADAAVVFPATASADYEGVLISEVQTHSAGAADDSLSDGDWIELHNTNTALTPARDLSNAILSDQDDNHIIRIASGTTLANGQFLAIKTDNPDTHVASGSFDLGDADSIRLFTTGSLDRQPAHQLRPQDRPEHPRRQR